MLKIENTEVIGWEHAIRGMRNPKNSWERSDTTTCGDIMNCSDCTAIDERGKCGLKGYPENTPAIGPNDHSLMMSLAKGGSVHAKYRRMITVYVDITAPLYWWKEFDTYKVGTVANSCSTMHKIHAKEFTLEDFSTDHLNMAGIDLMKMIIGSLNEWRSYYCYGFDSGEYRVDKGDKESWWQMIQLLPTSYNQKRTVMLNYEVLAGIYPMRKDHKLDEWHTFCNWIEKLPYSELITG